METLAAGVRYGFAEPYKGLFVYSEHRPGKPTKFRYIIKSVGRKDAVQRFRQMEILRKARARPATTGESGL